MGEALAALFLAFGLVIGVAALFAVLQIIYPRSVADARTIYELAPRRCFWFGLVNFALFAILAQVGIAIGQESGGDGGVLGLIAALPALLGMLFGLAGIAKMIGERLVPARNERDHIAIGGAVLTTACLVPFVGWFFLLPLLTIAGLGASVLAVFQRRRAGKQSS